jgi:hypothetical protein
MNTTTPYIVLASLMSLSAASTTLGNPDSKRADAASATTASDQVLVATEAGPTRFPVRDITTIGTSPYDWAVDDEVPTGRKNHDLPSAGEQIKAINAFFGLDPGAASDSRKQDGRAAAPGLLEPLHDPMDVDQNGVVEFRDFVQLIRWFGTEEGDLNQDGQTDGADIGLMLDRLANQNP